MTCCSFRVIFYVQYFNKYEEALINKSKTPGDWAGVFYSDIIFRILFRRSVFGRLYEYMINVFCDAHKPPRGMFY